MLVFIIYRVVSIAGLTQYTTEISTIYLQLTTVVLFGKAYPVHEGRYSSLRPLAAGLPLERFTRVFFFCFFRAINSRIYVLRRRVKTLPGDRSRWIKIFRSFSLIISRETFPVWPATREFISKETEQETISRTVEAAILPSDSPLHAHTQPPSRLMYFCSSRKIEIPPANIPYNVIYIPSYSSVFTPRPLAVIVARW